MAHFLSGHFVAALSPLARLPEKLFARSLDGKVQQYQCGLIDVKRPAARMPSMQKTLWP